MVVREMTPEDLGQVAHIEQEYDSPWTPALLSAELAYSGSIAYVAVDSSGLVVGWCCARTVATESELLKIAVWPMSRRHGIARLLLCTLLKKLREKKIVTLFLEVRSRNEPACCFYRANGFIEVGVRSGYYSNPKDNALIFRKDLPDIED